MSAFEIYDSKPVIYYVFNVTVNLHNGTVEPRQVNADTDQLHRRVPNTNKSEFVFPSTDTGEGLVQVWYIVLENEKSYLYAVGTILSQFIKVGGYFGDIKKENVSHLPILNYLQTEAKIWAGIYAQKEQVKLIEEINKLLSNLNKK